MAWYGTDGRVTYSNWIVTYWTRMLGAAIGPLNFSLRGHGQVAANPTRVIYGKPRRNCTMHMGCIPPREWSRVMKGKGFL